MPSLVDFHDEILDVFISPGCVVKVRFQTAVTRMREGHEERISEWQDPIREFDIAPALLGQEDLDSLIAFFRARRGQKYSFRFRDPIDYDVTAMPFGTGDGVTTTFQLSKTYNSGLPGDSAFYIRPIMLPDAGALIYNNAVLQVSGVAVNTTTGVVTYDVAPANGVALTWTGTFRIPVRFMNDYIYPRIENYLNFDAEVPLLEQRSLINATILTETAVPDFVETQFPPQYAEGSTTGPMSSAIIIGSDSGQESRTVQFTSPLLRFEVSDVHRNLSDLVPILHFFLNRKGRAVGFRMKDLTDYFVILEGIGVGDDVLTTFQLVKTYISGGDIQVRNITKPVTGLTVYLDGSPADPQPTINYSTGVITFASPVPAGVEVSWTGEFDVPVRFDTDELEISITGFEDYNLGSTEFTEIKTDLPVISIGTSPIDLLCDTCIDKPPVTQYIDFNLKTGNIFLPSHSFLQFLTLSSRCTMAFLVSHTNTGGTLFYNQGPYQSTAYSVVIGGSGRTLRVTCSGGGVALAPVFNGGSLSWFCGGDDRGTDGAVFSNKSGVSPNDGLRAYVVTVDWANGSYYCSGSAFGKKFGAFDDGSPFVQSDTCLREDVATSEEVIIGRAFFDVTHYWGIFAGQFPQNTSLGGQNDYPPDENVLDRFNGRMYEMFLFVERVAETKKSLTKEKAIINAYHMPIMRFWLSRYGVGYPLVSAPSLRAHVGAWWRADENVTYWAGGGVENQYLESWAPSCFFGADEDGLTWQQEFPTSGVPRVIDIAEGATPVFVGNLFDPYGKRIR